MLNSKQKDSKPRLLKVFIILIVAILLIGLSTVVYLVLQDDNKDRRNNSPSSELAMKFAYSALLEKEIIVESDEINAFIAKQVEQKKFRETIKAINIKTQTNSSIANVYVCFECCGVYLGSTFDTEITLNSDNKLEFNIVKAKVGRLPIPKRFIGNIIGKILGDTVEVQDTTVFINSAVKLNEFNTEINLTLSKIEIKEGKFILKFSGGVDALKKVLGESLNGLLSFIKK